MTHCSSSAAAVLRFAPVGVALILVVACRTPAAPHVVDEPRHPPPGPAVAPATRSTAGPAGDAPTPIETSVADAGRLADDGYHRDALAMVDQIRSRDPQNDHATENHQRLEDEVAVPGKHQVGRQGGVAGTDDRLCRRQANDGRWRVGQHSLLVRHAQAPAERDGVGRV
jgi:hypothetical protein